MTVFLLYAKLKQNILKLIALLFFFASYKASLKKRSETSLPASFSAWFMNICLVIFYQLTIFICLTAFSLWDIARYDVSIVRDMMYLPQSLFQAEPFLGQCNIFRSLSYLRIKILIFLKSQEKVLSVKQRRNQGTRKHFFSILVFFHRQWKGKDHLYSSLPHASAHEHPGFYSHLCIWSILRANILHFDHSEFSSQIKLSRSINS